MISLDGEKQGRSTLAVFIIDVCTCLEMKLDNFPAVQHCSLRDRALCAFAIGPVLLPNLLCPEVDFQVTSAPPCSSFFVAVVEFHFAARIRDYAAWYRARYAKRYFMKAYTTTPSPSGSNSMLMKGSKVDVWWLTRSSQEERYPHVTLSAE